MDEHLELLLATHRVVNQPPALVSVDSLFFRSGTRFWERLAANVA